MGTEGFKSALLSTLIIASLIAPVILLTILSHVSYAQSSPEIPSDEIKIAADKQIQKISNSFRGKGNLSLAEAWKEAFAGEPILVYTPKEVPCYYIIPVIRNNKVISTIGFSAKTGEWMWYTETCPFNEFPPVSVSEAEKAALAYLQERELKGSLDAPKVKSMPDKCLYWVFPLIVDERVVTKIYVSFISIEKICIAENIEGKVSPITGDVGGGGAAMMTAPLKIFQTSPQTTSHTISSVPHHYQAKYYYCGPASLEMVFDYYGPDISQYEIANAARTDSSYWGTYADDVRRAAHFSDLSTSVGTDEPGYTCTGYTGRGLGYAAFHAYGSGFQTMFNYLKSSIDEDYPIIVLTWYDTSHSSGHYRVAIGYDDSMSEVIVHDPWNTAWGGVYGGPNLHLSYSTFQDLWSYSGNWGIFTHPWVVSINTPDVISGLTFELTATVSYPCPPPYPTISYPASSCQATIALPPDLSLAPGETTTKTLGTGSMSAGTSTTVSWQIIGPPGSYSVTISAEGRISGSVQAHGSYPAYSYTDRIGGVQTSTITVPEVRGVDVSIYPSYQNGFIEASLSYIVGVRNIGNVLDTYTLNVSDNAGWGPSISLNSLVVPPGENRSVTLSVTIPENAVECTQDNITVTAIGTGVSDSESCIAHSLGVFASRDPIVIISNADFTYANGVIAGSGTEGDPYVIANWYIISTEAHGFLAKGITISDTNAHFIIGNCWIHGQSDGAYAGIFFDNVTNGKIENILVDNYDGPYAGPGIYLSGSRNIAIKDCIVMNNSWGIALWSSENIILDNNYLSNNKYNFSIRGSTLSHFFHDIDISNTIDGKPIFYLKDNLNAVIDSLEVGYLGLVSCDNVLVKNLRIVNNGEGVLLAYAKNSKVKNSTFMNSSSGIYLHDSDNNIIENSSLSNNKEHGLYLSASNNNIIQASCIENSDYVVLLSGSENNIVENCTILGGGIRGIMLSGSNNNILSYNIVRGGYYVIDFEYSNNNIFSNNIVENNYGIGLQLGHSNNNIFSNNIVLNNFSGGVWLYYSNSNVFSKNILNKNGGYGISVYIQSDNNLIYQNILGNNGYGIWIHGTYSDNNLIYHNNFISNVAQAYDDGVNYWDNGYPSGGNYWSDYTGSDNYGGENQDITENDGIGDTPYIIPPGYNTDRYPLMAPTVDVIPPSKPTLVSPENNKIDNKLGQTFTWTKPEAGLTFHIQIDNEPSFAPPYVHENSVVVENLYSYIFAANGVYHWRVRAKDAANNWGPWAENFKLTIEGALIPHVPIHIIGNSNFTSANGVVAGSGTENDPYIIENWTIDASSADGIWIEDTSVYFVIRNCLVENGASYYGIYLDSVIRGKIETCVVENVHSGISLQFSSNNTILGSTVKKNSTGVRLGVSSNNLISNNEMVNNYTGIYIGSSSNNTISNNNVDNNYVGISLSSSSSNTISNNNVDNNYVGIYLYSSSSSNTISGNTVENNDLSGIILYPSSDNNTISGNTVGNNNSYGVYLYSSSNNTISGNTVNNNDYGIYLYYYSSSNTISGSSIENNSYGIRLESSSDNNAIYHNNLINNATQAYDTGTNYWDNGYPSGGNYWSDYTGVDIYWGENQNKLGSDGIGDTLYYISGGANRDRYPLMNPWPSTIWRIIETWTGTVQAPAQWQVIETLTGTVEAPAAWQLIETWIGTIETPAEWQLIEIWTGTVKVPDEWRLIETWSGTVSASAGWRLIEIWTGTAGAPIGWNLIETWTGTIQAPVAWQNIETWTGTIQTPAEWQFIETWTGTVEAPVEWKIIEIWTGTIETPPPWAGTAAISLADLYTVNVEKILDLYRGSNLVVKFYTYGDAFENENVIENFSPPWHVEENEKARHPGIGGVDKGVKKARLDLTTDNTENVISTIASFTVQRLDLEIRFSNIPGEWFLAQTPEERLALEIEFSEIPFYWFLAPP